MIVTGLWGLLTVVFLGLALMFAVLAAVYVRRLESRPSESIDDEIGGPKALTRKVRKGEPMSRQELAYVTELVGRRSSVMAFCIPATLFSLGCFYICGSLYHLHGATPSERTFLGIFPMLASMNFTTQILRSIRLKRRLRKISPVAETGDLADSRI